jgi:hypothetical protein
MKDFKVYLIRAKDLYKKAEEEFIKVREDGDEYKLRQVAEKAWLSAVEATNALILNRKLRVPRGSRRREDILFDLQTKDKNIARLNLGEKYGYFMRSLHIDAFYDGDVSIKRIERDLRKVEEYTKEIEAIGT